MKSYTSPAGRLVFIVYLIFTFLPTPIEAQKKTAPDSLQALLSLALIRNDSSGIFKNYYAYARDHYKKNDFENALNYFNKALPYADSAQIVKIINYRGSINWMKGDYENAMREYNNALKQAEKIGRKDMQAYELNNIGMVYTEFNRYDKANEYYQKALALRKEIGDKDGTGMTYIRIAGVYMADNKPDTAYQYYKNALNLFTKTENELYRSNALNGMGNALYEQKHFTKALNYHLEALEIREELKHIFLKAESYKNLIKIYTALNQYNKATVAAEKGIYFAKQHGSKKLLKNLYYEKYEMEKKIKNDRLALESFELYTAYKDSLLTADAEKNIREIEEKYQTEKRKKEIEVLSLKTELDTQTIRRQKTRIFALSGGGGFVLISLLVLTALYFQRNRAYKALVKQNVEIAQLQKTQPDKTDKREISDSDKIIRRLENALEKEKCYLNPHCSLEFLAKQIDTNRQYLSEIINSYFKTNFSRFINTYRVKEARKILTDEQFDKYTMDALAEMCGFNNRATFNSAFKKETGLSPSFFKKEKKKHYKTDKKQ